MKKIRFNFLKEYFDFGRIEQRGISILFALILIVICFNLILPHLHFTDGEDFSKYIGEINEFSKSLAYVDSTSHIPDKQIDLNEVDRSFAERQLHPFPFNPNGLPEEKWKEIGLSDRQIRIIKNFEAKGGKFYKKEDLQKVYGISEVDYQVLEPFIQIPEAKYEKKTFTAINNSPPTRVIEINSADSSTLLAVKGIGPFFARRIIKYRDRLGGFERKEQLLEVYGMDSNRYFSILPHISVDSTLIRKVNLNTATFKDLIKNPYIDFYLAGAIMKYRNKKGKFSTLQELMYINLISEDIYRKISPYFTVY